MGNKIGIIYFSGTGNTKFVAQNIAKKLQQWGEELDLINIEKDKIIPTQYIYPKDNLKNYKNKCMLFATQASEKDSTAYQHFINNMPNLNVTYCIYVPMPNNVYNFFFKRTEDEKQAQMITNVDDIIETSLKSFLDGETKLYPRNKFIVFMINLVYKMVYPMFIKSINKKINIDNDKCINCKLCEKSCPVGCIKIDKVASYTKDCLFCQRCINICPKNAFTYKNKKLSQYKPRFKIEKTK